jgi:MoaA/NifB/PqqE/SkfB family radical SAM enzyme
MSKVFCMAPWTHMHGLPSGDVIACCLSPTSETLGNLREQSLTDIWNSERLRGLRRNMLAGIATPSICGRCYDKEKHGLTSLRTGMNNKYETKYAALVDSTPEDGTVEKLNIVHWDFRFSNICNLSCRSCGPGLSSKWYDDYIKLLNPSTQAEYRRTNPRIEKMVSNEEFWEIVEPLMPSVESIHFAGGEPLIMDEHWRIMDRLIAAKNFNIDLHYSTNFTNLTYKGRNAIDIWQLFKNVLLSLSIDGVGPAFDYLRSGARWETIVENLQILNQYPQIRRYIYPTIGAANVLNVLDLHRTLLENEWLVPGQSNHYLHQFLLNNLITPPYYSVKIFPPAIKTMVAERIIQHANWGATHYGLPRNGWDGLIGFMMEDDLSHLIPKFREITGRLDAIRGENFYDVFPEWNGIL